MDNSAKTWLLAVATMGLIFCAPQKKEENYTRRDNGQSSGNLGQDASSAQKKKKIPEEEPKVDPKTDEDPEVVIGDPKDKKDDDEVEADNNEDEARAPSEVPGVVRLAWRQIGVVNSAPQALIFRGDFSVVGDAESNGVGVAQLIVTQHVSELSVLLSGLAVETNHNVHLHAQPCEQNAGGGHYKIDPSVETVIAGNEIWPSFVTDANGAGAGYVESSHLVRGDGLSVVVHSPEDGSKMLCADLVAVGDLTRVGDFLPLPNANPEFKDDAIAGAAYLATDDEGTYVFMSLSGLNKEEEYVSHVHNLPCSMGGGGHYKIDTTEDMALEENELWPDLSLIAEKEEGLVEFAAEHIARADAQSIVIHRVEEDGKPKVSCADLKHLEFGDDLRQGDLALLDAANTAGLTDIEGSASILRTGDYVTRVNFEVTQGLVADTAYPAHLHNLPCNVVEGGAHYKHDVFVEGTIEENEVFLSIVTDAMGKGSSEVFLSDKMLRSDGISVVLHNTDGSRLACADLVP